MTKSIAILFTFLLFPTAPLLLAQIDTVNMTQYDLQAVGPASNRIAVDSQGGVHVAYLQSSSYPTTRGLYYGYRNSSGTWFNYNLGTGLSGFPKLALNSEGTAGILATSITSGLNLWTPDGTYLIDSTGYGVNINYDSQDNIDVVFYHTTDNYDFPYRLYYTRSADHGNIWSEPQFIDSLGLGAVVITSSPVSAKSAIIYPKKIDADNYMQNDIIYIESSDGQNWDFQNGKINITEYGGTPDYATMDFDAIYDFDDQLHIVWVSQVRDTVIGPATIWEYYAANSDFRQIRHTNFIWPEAGCDMGTWNTVFGKVSLARNIVGDMLYLFYTTYSEYDCSQGGYANAEICYQYSDYYSGAWSVPVDVTNTHTPRCAPGDCESETNPSIARTEDGMLHLFYVEDKDAGGVPYTEGGITSNPLVYRTVEAQRVVNDPHAPAEFCLYDNYPNPFNAVTVIQLHMERRAHLTLSIYDIGGSLVETILDETREAGDYTVRWDAGKFPSGVYFCRAAIGGGEISRKMVLLK